MNKSGCKPWVRFKEGFFWIVALSIIQIWGSFKFPGIMSLEVPWSIFWVLGKSILGVASVIYLFSYIDNFAWLLRLDFIKDSPDCSASTNKKIAVAGFVTPFVVFAFFIWDKNFCQISNAHWAFIFANWILLWALLYKAACRVDLTD